eukprot:TRINITY_DN817_c0_g1_i5.p1 TRINITY_DN817_c0_g1~~TRINITY_DN817_c0_g1_i5.p1  ORF type:complete len:385 (+),score=62.42 TRINITY_DN817_c0_g1_i5:176-1330(+)
MKLISTITRPLKLMFVGDSLASQMEGPLTSFYCDLNKESEEMSKYDPANASNGPNHKMAWISISSGLEEYLYAVNAFTPDYVFIPISAKPGIDVQTKEYIGIALTLRKPTVLLLTKTELTKESEYLATLRAVEIMVTRWMKKEAILLSSTVSTQSLIKQTLEGTAVPIITTPASGDMHQLKQLICSLEVARKEADKEFLCEVWVTKIVGKAEEKIVCEGVVKTGRVQVGKYLKLGLFNDKFCTIVVRKVTTYEVVKSAGEGERILFEAVLVETKKRKVLNEMIEKTVGLIAVEKVDKKRLAQEFDAEIAVLTKEPVKEKQSFTVFSANLHTAVTLQDTEKEVLVQGDRGIVRCKLKEVKWVREREKVFLVSDRVAAIGVITKAY